MKSRRFYKIRSAVAKELYEYRKDHDRKGQLQELSEESVCYLADYDDTEKAGLIFLGLKLPKDYDPGTTGRFSDWQFLKVNSGFETTAADYENQNCLRTIPPIAFKTCFYLNVSQPLWVKLQYLEPFNDLKRLHLPLPPPVAGAKKAPWIPQAPQVILDPESEFAFLKIRCRYSPIVAYHFLSTSRKKKERSSGDLDGEILQGAPSVGVEVEGSQAEAKYGRIGQFQISHDIPFVMSSVSSWTAYEDSESEDENGDYNKEEDEDSGCSGREKENNEEKDEVSGCSSEKENSKEEESKDYSEEEEDENDKEEGNEYEDWDEVDWSEDWDEISDDDSDEDDTTNEVDSDRLYRVVLMDIDIFKPHLKELESDMRTCMISNPGATLQPVPSGPSPGAISYVYFGHNKRKRLIEWCDNDSG